MRLSGELCRFCKAVNAGMADTCTDCLRECGNKTSYIRAHGGHQELYIGPIAAYSLLHIGGRIRRSGPTRSEGRASQAPRCVEPPPRSGTRPLVLERTLLRRARSCASQVRDAALRSVRGRQKVRGSLTLRRFATDVLSSGSRILQGWTGRAVAETARSKEPPQAYARSHGVHRRAVGNHALFRCSCPVSTDQDRAWPCRSSPQYRARPGAEKKTTEPRVTVTLAPTAVAIYETLRTAVLHEQARRPEGLGTIIYHGLIDGLAVLMLTVPKSVPAIPRSSSSITVARDPELLRLLANMVLQTQSELKHVY
jgi:hypothetical protein